MSQPIEDELIALNTLSKLRQWKPLELSANRAAQVSDFGRLIVLQATGLGSQYTLPAVMTGTLVRSGTIRVMASGDALDSSLITSAATNDPIDTETREAITGNLTFDNVSIYELTYDHEENQWYITSLVKVAMVAQTNGVNAEKLVKYNSGGNLESFDRLRIHSAGDESHTEFVSTTTLVIIWLNRNNLDESVDISLPEVGGTGRAFSFQHTLVTYNGVEEAGFVACCTGAVNDAGAASQGVVLNGLYYNSTSKQFVTRQA